MLDNCISLSSLPDISKWNYDDLINNHMQKKSFSALTLPGKNYKVNAGLIVILEINPKNVTKQIYKSNEININYEKLLNKNIINKNIIK